MTELRWFHPPLNGGEEQGLNEAGIQDFKRPKALARETCQNIGDARPEGATAPAIATFELVSLPAAELPGLDQLRKIFAAGVVAPCAARKCHAAGDDNAIEYTIDHVNHATTVVCASKTADIVSIQITAQHYESRDS